MNISVKNITKTSRLLLTMILCIQAQDLLSKKREDSKLYDRKLKETLHGEERTHHTVTLGEIHQERIQRDIDAFANNPTPETAAIIIQRWRIRHLMSADFDRFLSRRHIECFPPKIRTNMIYSPRFIGSKFHKQLFYYQILENFKTNPQYYNMLSSMSMKMMEPRDVQVFTTDHIRKIHPTFVGFMSSMVLKTILLKKDLATAFTWEQLSRIQENQLESFTQEDITAIVGEDFASLPPAIITFLLQHKKFAQCITTEQLQSIKSFASFSPDMLRILLEHELSSPWMIENQLKDLVKEYLSYNTDNMPQYEWDFYHMTGALIVETGLKTGCISDDIIKTILEKDISSMPSISSDALKTLFLRKIFPKAFTWEQLYRIQENQLESFTQEDITAIVGEDFASLPPAIITFLLQHKKLAQWITTEQLQSIKSFASFSPGMLKILLEHVLSESWMTENQFKCLVKEYISYNTDNMTQDEYIFCYIIGAQIIEIGLKIDCISHDIIKTILEKDIKSMLAISSDALKILFLRKIVPKAFTWGQLSRIQENQLESFTQEDITAIVGEDFASLPPVIITFLLKHKKFAQCIRKEQLQSIKSFASFSPEMLMILFQHEFFSPWMTQNQLNSITEEHFSSDCGMTYLFAKNLLSIGSKIAYVSPHVIEIILAKDILNIGKISSDTLKTMLLRKNFSKIFTLRRLSKIKDNQLESFTQKDIAGISDADFASLSPEILSFFLNHEKCAQWVTRRQLKSITKQQVAQLHFGQLDWKIGSRVAYLSPNVIKEFFKERFREPNAPSFIINTLGFLQKKHFSTFSNKELNDLIGMPYIGFLSPEVRADLLERDDAILRNILEIYWKIDYFKKNDEIALVDSSKSEVEHKDYILFDNVVNYFSQFDAQDIGEQSGKQLTASQIAGFQYKTLESLLWNQKLNLTKEQLGDLTPYHFLRGSEFMFIPIRYFSLFSPDTKKLFEDNWIKIIREDKKKEDHFMILKQKENMITRFLRQSYDDYAFEKAKAFIHSQPHDNTKSFQRHHAVALMAHFMLSKEEGSQEEMMQLLGKLYWRQGMKMTPSMQFILNILEDLNFNMDKTTSAITAYAKKAAEEAEKEQHLASLQEKEGKKAPVQDQEEKSLSPKGHRAEDHKEEEEKQ